ncbi:MAG: hypothetical protein EBR40_04910 [Proteobacteria bacterium]|nr:hypothetical protein [Pseudomonadota bacterium]
MLYFQLSDALKRMNYFVGYKCYPELTKGMLLALLQLDIAMRKLRLGVAKGSLIGVVLIKLP